MQYLHDARLLPITITLIGCILLVAYAPHQASQAASPNTWYVAPEGNDGNDCFTVGTPCKTVSGAVSKAAQGDAVMLAAGTYPERLTLDKSLTISAAGCSQQSAVGSHQHDCRLPTADCQATRYEFALSCLRADEAILDGGANGTVITITGPISPTTAVALTGLTIRNGSAGILNEGILILSHSRILAQKGSGIVNHRVMAVTQTLISANTGGGLTNGSSGRLELLDVTISNNTAGFGGGIYNTGAMTLTNVTISNNSAIIGGGIYTEGPAPIVATTPMRDTSGDIQYLSATRPTMRLNNVTISGNSASSQGGGIYTNPFTLVVLRNTIIAQNEPVNCQGTQMLSGGYNLSDDASCGLTALGDQTQVDPLLGPLQANGGVLPTQALRPGSPAIDRGDPAHCPATDQRGIVRPADGNGDGNAACDIGAYELRWSFRFLPMIPVHH